MNAAGTHTQTLPAPACAVDRAAHTVSAIVSPDVQIIITIDGPAGTGKSTVARRLAAQIGLDFLDTGAMYRAATAIVIDHGLVEELEADRYSQILEKVVDADLHFDWKTDPPAILAWMEPLNDRIRQPDVTRLVSKIATISTLRKHMVQKQRIIGHQHPRLVTEGRDQGSIAFPDAAVKFFLDAEPSVRASRRADQLRAAGHSIDEAELLASIIERDRIDSTRSDGPLICPENAIRIDTSSLDIDGVVETLADHAAGILARLAPNRD